MCVAMRKDKWICRGFDLSTTEYMYSRLELTTTTTVKCECYYHYYVVGGATGVAWEKNVDKEDGEEPRWTGRRIADTAKEGVSATSERRRDKKPRGEISKRKGTLVHITSQCIEEKGRRQKKRKK